MYLKKRYQIKKKKETIYRIPIVIVLNNLSTKIEKEQSGLGYSSHRALLTGMSLSIHDRTYEFQQCISSFDKLNRKQGGIQQHPGEDKATKRSQFSHQASIIAKDIAHVTEMLGKLALLTKRKPMFDDRPVEIGQLTYMIKQDIFKVEENIKRLQAFTKGDSSMQVDNQISLYSKNVLNLLNSKMKNVSGEFKNVLEVRQKNELLNKSRVEQFLSASASHRASNSPSPFNQQSNSSSGNLSNLGENPYLSQTQEKGSFLQRIPDDDPDVSFPYSNSNNGGEFLSIPDQSQQMLLMEEQSDQYLQQRRSAVEAIESTINEVGNLFQQLASMVSEQGEVIQRIDMNVEDIDMNISGAQRELLKYYAHILNNRWLFLKIFGVLMIFFLIWVLVK